MDNVEIIDSSLEGCRGVVVGERYGDCFIIEFTYVPNNYFQLPCTQVIAKKFVRKIQACVSDGSDPAISEM